MHHLVIDSLSASYGNLAVLDGISLSVDKGQIVSLIGPSGSGKSTLLRVLVGLLPPDRGTIMLDGQAIDYASKAAIRAVRDRFAIVFQQYNLFGNMTVLSNVTVAPIKVKGRPRAEVVRMTAEGVPFLAAEVILLFKAKYRRDKDETDFANALPKLDRTQRQWLKARIAQAHPGHGWLQAL